MPENLLSAVAPSDYDRKHTNWSGLCMIERSHEITLYLSGYFGQKSIEDWQSYYSACTLLLVEVSHER